MKDLIISKELISEVLNIPKKVIMDIYTDGNYLLIRKTNGRIEEYNIYGFAFKCKEWALNKGYTIESHTNRSCLSGNNYEYFSIAKIFKGTSSMRINTIEENTEIESTIQACEWILSEVNK